MSELDDLRARVAAAERVCLLFGITAAARTESDRDKALHQAWSEWQGEYGRGLPRPTEAEITTLAARRDVIRNNTLVRLNQRERARLDEDCRATVLEAIYERQHEPDVFAAHVWGEWRPYDRNPEYQHRHCADCRRVQTRYTPEAKP